MSAAERLKTILLIDKRRGHKFFPPAGELRAIPALYSTDGGGIDDKVIHLHLFCGACDWYVAEFDPKTGLAFGWAELLAGMGEWGTFDLLEIGELIVGPYVVERDLDWTPRPWKEVGR